jgi:hypothetical protein
MVLPGTEPALATPPAAQRAAEAEPVSAEAPHVLPAPEAPAARRLPAVPPASEVPAPGAPPAATAAPTSVAPLVGARPLHPVQRMPDDEPPPPGGGGPPGSPAPPGPRSILTAATPPTGAPAPAVPLRRTPPVQRAPEGVPADLRRDLEPMLGADLSSVKVHRGEESAQAATELKAKAFTTGGEVHIPDKHGPLNSGEGRSILAHETTHAVQQSALGSALPPEDSPEGQRLEDEARQVAGRLEQPQRLPDPELTHVQRIAVQAPGAAAASASRSAPSSDLSPAQARELVGQVQRAALESGVATPDGAGVRFAQPPAGDDGGPAFLDGVQRASDARSAAAAPAPSQGADGERGRGGDLDYDAIFHKLYPMVRSKLKGELLLARERSGSLADRR